MNEPKKLSEAMLDFAERGCCVGPCKCPGHPCKVIRALLGHIEAMKHDLYKAKRLTERWRNDHACAERLEVAMAGIRLELDEEIATLDEIKSLGEELTEWKAMTLEKLQGQIIGARK